MAKTSGLGDALLVDGYNLSGDTQDVKAVKGGIAPIDVTGIDKSAYERIGGIRDGGIEWTSHFNTSVNQQHAVLSTLPTTDRQVGYLRGQALGNPAAACVAKQLNYDMTRGQDGKITLDLAAEANAYGLQWGIQLTSGVQTTSNFLTGQNTSFEGGIGNWVTNVNSSVAASSAQAHGGTGSLAITSSASGNASAKHCLDANIATQGFTTTPGSYHLLQGWFRSAVSARSCLMAVNWFTSGGVFITSSTAASVTSSTSSWTLCAGSVTAPATAAYGAVIAQIQSTAAASEVHYVDDVSLLTFNTAYDFGADAAGNYDATAFIHVTALTGTDITFTVDTSQDNGVTDPFTTRITSSSFTAIGAQRVTQTSPGSQTMERYARLTATTTAGFTSASYVVVLARNETAVSF